jgi:hypothetical protein
VATIKLARLLDAIPERTILVSAVHSRRSPPARQRLPLGKHAGGSYAATATPAALDPSDALQLSGITHRAVLYPATIGAVAGENRGSPPETQS